MTLFKYSAIKAATIKAGGFAGYTAGICLLPSAAPLVATAATAVTGCALGPVTGSLGFAVKGVTTTLAAGLSFRAAVSNIPENGSDLAKKVISTTFQAGENLKKKYDVEQNLKNIKNVCAKYSTVDLDGDLSGCVLISPKLRS